MAVGITNELPKVEKSKGAEDLNKVVGITNAAINVSNAFSKPPTGDLTSPTAPTAPTANPTEPAPLVPDEPGMAQGTSALQRRLQKMNGGQ